jgi:hypothetical protein
MNKEYLEALDWLEEKCYVENPQAEKFEECCKIIRQFLYRLEAIDNAEPSEALECLEFICKILNEKRIDVKWLFKNEYTTIKQALLKQQELPEPFKTGVDIGVIKPKQYLKWEDLEFNHTPKMIDVKMNGNKYKLVVGYNVAGNNLAILRDGKKEYYFLECDKQFFNDLHLEMVEE